MCCASRGLYGFYAIGFGDSGESCRIASGCANHSIHAGGKDVLAIELREIPHVRCSDAGSPDAGQEDASGSDASGSDAATIDDGGVRDVPGCEGGSDEVCNDFDDDCDGKVDEDFHLLTNPESCGSCTRVCATDQACAGGACAPPIVQVAMGGTHTCTLRADGRVFCWGANVTGQVGDGTTRRRVVPTLVRGLDDVQQVAAGGAHTCALLVDGTAYCWGVNIAGQLGNGGYIDRTVPTSVVDLEHARSLGPAATHNCAIVDSGAVRCWGANVEGELGTGTFGSASPIPQDVVGLTDATHVQGGYEFTCARTARSEMYCWGRNTYGQLGDGTFTSRPAPQRVRGLTNVRQFAAGGGHVCAIQSNGAVVCWGDGMYGQLANGEEMLFSTRPIPAGVPTASKMSSGNSGVCALLNDHSVLCWGGGNTAGERGDGTRRELSYFESPSSVLGLDDATDISEPYADGHACAIRANHNVVCWGRNEEGQLGIGRTSPSGEPVPVTVVGL